VGVKYLSEEWATAVQDALNSHEGFKNAAGSQTAKIQNVVTTTDGESKYYIKIEGGQVELKTGEIDAPEATITQDYDTAVALSKGELTGTAAYMSGKIKIAGDLMKMMALQGALSQVNAATSSIEVEY